MTRKVVITGVIAVCATALLVGVIAYVLVARDARNSEDRVLRGLASHPQKIALSPAFTYDQLAQKSNARGIVVQETIKLQEYGQLPTDLRRGFTNQELAGHALRVYTRVRSDGSRLSVAVFDSPARSDLAALRRGVAIAIIAGALFASLLLIWVTRRALAPVRETAAVADRIVSTGDLTARVPEPSGSDEIAQLTHSLNRMLGHLEDSDAALRRLVADASHELRSPVTTVIGNLELLTTRALSPADREEALADTHAEAQRLGRLVEDLLALARADTVKPTERIVLAELVAEAIEGTGARLLHPSAEFATATVRGDPVALRVMVHNLAENGDHYGGGAEVSIDGDARSLDIHVADRGPGVGPREREQIFDRFHRGESSIGRSGSGLGLAIVAAPARAHGGSVEVVPPSGSACLARTTRGEKLLGNRSRRSAHRHRTAPNREETEQTQLRTIPLD